MAVLLRAAAFAIAAAILLPARVRVIDYLLHLIK
jgi:hypothetical protein